MPYFYIITAPDNELELAHAEFAVMAGGQAEGRVGWSEIGVDITNAAYVSLCVRGLARAPDFDGLCVVIAGKSIEADGFAIRVIRQASSYDKPSPELCKELADVIVGSPNLDAPRIEFCLLIREEELWFGQVVSRSKRGWQRRLEPLQQYSWALPSRFARALVNLVAAPGDRLLDVCCGVGTVVAEALDMGVEAYGCEINKKIAGMAAHNLMLLGYNGRIAVADARQMRGSFDAVVADLPYGHTSTIAAGLYAEILTAAGKMAPRAVVVTAGDVEELLDRLGYRAMLQAQVPKGKLTRYVYLLATG